MRKAILLVLALACIASMFAWNNSIAKTISVFLKNGAVEHYSASEVSSIEFISLDREGVKHDEPIGQKINFIDDESKTYMFDELERVDFGCRSVKKVKDVVKEIDSVKHDYIESFLNDSIVWRPETPKKFLPSVGDLIYYEGISNIFPNGMCAKVLKRVEDLSGRVVLEVEKVSPLDIYDAFVIAYNELELSPTEIDFIAEESDVDIYETEEEEDDNKHENRPLNLSRATVFDGQSSYHVSSNVKFKIQEYVYDVRTGDFRVKIGISIDGDYDIHYQCDKKKNLTFATKNDIKVPLPAEFFTHMDPSLSFKLLFKVKANDAKVDASLKRKHTASFIMTVLNGDTLVYNPEIKAAASATTAYQGQDFLDGTLSLVNSFTLKTRPLYRDKGINVMPSITTSLTNAIGTKELRTLSEEIVDTLYNKSEFKETSTISLSATMTEYKGKELKSTTKMNTIGKLSKTITDCVTRMFPKIESIKMFARDGDSFFTFEQKYSGTLVSPVEMEVNVTNRNTNDIVLNQPIGTVESTTGSTISSNLSFSSSEGFSSMYFNSFKVGLQCHYAGYLLHCDEVIPFLESKLYGTWLDSWAGGYEKLEFNKDHTLVQTEVDDEGKFVYRGEFMIDTDRKIVRKIFSSSDIRNMYYIINGNQLKLKWTDGEVVGTYTRQ